MRMTELSVVLPSVGHVSVQHRSSHRYVTVPGATWLGSQDKLSKGAPSLINYP